MIQLSENRTGMLANIRNKIKHLRQFLAGHKPCGAVGSLVGIDKVAPPVVFAAFAVAHPHDHEDQHVDGILEAWYLGTMAGHGMADVISGDYNPSARLTMSFPRTVGQLPLHPPSAY